MKATVVCASNRAAAGVYEDTTGPLIVEALAGLGGHSAPKERKTTVIFATGHESGSLSRCLGILAAAG